MAVYNDSFMNNATNIVDLAVGVGIAMNNPYMIGNAMLFILGMIFIVTGFYSNRYFEAIISGSFVLTIVAILLWVGGMVMATTILFPFITFIVAFVLFLFS